MDWLLRFLRAPGENEPLPPWLIWRFPYLHVDIAAWRNAANPTANAADPV